MHGDQNRRSTLFIDEKMHHSFMEEKNITLKTKKLTVKNVDISGTRFSSWGTMMRMDGNISERKSLQDCMIKNKTKDPCAF
jgi:hypothetical protein